MNMKDVLIFEDGEIGRGQRAKLIKRGNKRVLIQFTYEDWDTEEDVTVTEWFKVFTRWDNNKRGFDKVKYHHPESNYFYDDYDQTEKFKEGLRGAIIDEYFEELFGE